MRPLIGISSETAVVAAGLAATTAVGASTPTPVTVLVTLDDRAACLVTGSILGLVSEVLRCGATVSCECAASGNRVGIVSLALSLIGKASAPGVAVSAGEAFAEICAGLASS